MTAKNAAAFIQGLGFGLAIAAGLGEVPIVSGVGEFAIVSGGGLLLIFVSYAIEKLVVEDGD